MPVRLPLPCTLCGNDSIASAGPALQERWLPPAGQWTSAVTLLQQTCQSSGSPWATALNSTCSGMVSRVLAASLHFSMLQQHPLTAPCALHAWRRADLTVREVLQLHAAVKGQSRQAAAESACQAAGDVGLADKLDSLAGELSGGQRRKLSVSAAFLGNPRLVILDEATSGMVGPVPCVVCRASPTSQFMRGRFCSNFAGSLQSALHMGDHT